MNATTSERPVDIILSRLAEGASVRSFLYPLHREHRFRLQVVGVQRNRTPFAQFLAERFRATVIGWER